jgi:gas vesicle protein
MSDKRTGDRSTFFLGAAIGVAAAVLLAPTSGARTRRRLRRRGEEVADYLIDAGKELVDKCEDLYERSAELVEDATHELSGKYRALREYSKQLLDEAETILRRTKNRENAPTGKYTGTGGGGTIEATFANDIQRDVAMRAPRGAS